MLVMSLVCMLMVAYPAKVEAQALRQARGIGQITLGYPVESWRLSLAEAAEGMLRSDLPRRPRETLSTGWAPHAGLRLSNFGCHDFS